MDPTNNPMQNTNPAQGDMAPGVDNGMGMNAGMGTGAGMGMNVGGPVTDGGAMAGGVPMNGGVAMGAPVNNAQMGGMPMGGTMAQPVGQMNGQMSPGQMFQAGGVAAPMGALGAIPGDYSSANSPLLAATDPITMPDGPKAPDPVEMELNAPFKAAGPVPGSIGSAISMPGDPNQVPNVAFNDPAMMAPNASMMPKKKSWFSRLGMDGGKKMDKKTLIILGAIVAVIVLAIIFIVVTAL